MKIAWFTPFNKKSAIGRVGREVCEELCKTCDIDIWTAYEDDLIETSVNVIKFKPEDVDLGSMSKYDHIIYNMGNFAGYHKAIWEVMKKLKGVVILHDQTMHSLFHQMLCMPEYGGDSEHGYERYQRLLEYYYGNKGVKATNSIWIDNDPVISNTELVSRLRLLQPLLENAKAVFTHAEFFADQLKDEFLGPIGYSYLPYNIQKGEDCTPLPDRLIDTDKIMIVSAGIVHPVKHIDRVANVLRKNPDIASKINFIVIGEYGGQYGEDLERLSKGALKGCLHMLGYQPDDVLKAYLTKADICVNLRYPNSEVCSYSLLEQMGAGKPVIVLRSGFFGEVQEDSVLKIDPNKEEEELESALRRLINDAALRETIGKNALDFVKTYCDVKEYACSLIELLETIKEFGESADIVNNTVTDVNSILKKLGFNQENLPWTIQGVTQQIQKVLLADETDILKGSRHILGIWVGFNYAISGLGREGIMRFLSFMVQSLMRNYDVDCEVWCYSFNENEIMKTFHDIVDDPELSGRIKVITEKNWTDEFNVSKIDALIVGDINEREDNLFEAARIYSKAECFVPAIIYLDNVIGVDRRIFVPAHDMAVHQYYEEFIRRDPLYKARFLDIGMRAEHLARSGVFMFCNCETVRRQQLLKHVKNIRESSTFYIYLPTNIPQGIEKRLLSEEQVREKYNIKNDYLFYPTQIRPYKNVSALIMAMVKLICDFKKLSLVLTGNPCDVPEVYTLIKENRLEDRIICISNVPEHELYSLYKYAAATPVPTLFEGGFPWQACEALYMNTPIVLSDIPIVRERIESLGFTIDNCGLETFDPYDSNELAKKLNVILKDRQSAVIKQQGFRDKLLSYTWDDAAEKYYHVFFEMNNK